MLERVLKCLCLYEAAALWTRKVPTVTSVVYRCRRGPLPLFATSLVGVLSLLFALAYHLLVDGWGDVDAD